MGYRLLGHGPHAFDLVEGGTLTMDQVQARARELAEATGSLVNVYGTDGVVCFQAAPARVERVTEPQTFSPISRPLAWVLHNFQPVEDDE